MKVGDVIHTTDGFYQVDDTKCIIAISEVELGKTCCITTSEGTFKVHRLNWREILKHYLKR